MLNLRNVSQSVGRIIEDNEFDDNTGTSFFTPGTLSGLEMGALRTMRAKTTYSQF